MGKAKKYLVNNTMFVFALCYIGILIPIAIVLFDMGRYLSSVVFAVLSIPFCIILFRYGSMVRVGNEGVFLSFLGVERKSMSWDEIVEVDVIGSRVLNRFNTKKCGTLYLVFSLEKLDDTKRFQMMLKWPPKDKIYVKFTKERLMEIQWYYASPVEKYNIGMLDI